MRTHLKNAEIVQGQHAYKAQTAKRGTDGFIMSRSSLHDFMENPRRWRDGYRDGDTSATEWGSLIDCLVLTPERFDALYVVHPDTYEKDVSTKKEPNKVEVKDWHPASHTCQQWIADNAKGRTVIAKEDLERGKQAASVIAADADAQDILWSAEKQVLMTAEYHDPETGVVVALQSLVDIVCGASSRYSESLCDFKTSRNASPKFWAREVFNYGLDMQGALYLDIFNAATGDGRFEFRHIVQESLPPYAVGHRLLSEDFLSLGRMRYLNALRRYCQCLNSDTWPGYEAPGVPTITRPENWMISQSTEEHQTADAPPETETEEAIP